VVPVYDFLFSGDNNVSMSQLMVRMQAWFVTMWVLKMLTAAGVAKPH